MKNKTKLIVAGLCMCSALTMAGCDANVASKEYAKLYQQYVERQKENNDKVLSYEKWLLQY